MVIMNLKLIERCTICDWPLAENEALGCTPGNCSYRPSEGSAEWRRIQERRAALAKEAGPLLLEALKAARTELGIKDDFVPFAISAELCGKIERAIAVAEGRAR